MYGCIGCGKIFGSKGVALIFSRKDTKNTKENKTFPQFNMAGLLTIELNKLRFFARHGLYAEEIKTGNEFEVNLSVSYLAETIVITDIAETINYVSLYELIKTVMQKPTPLLETVIMTIAEKIYQQFPHIKKTSISIAKLHPPIAKFIGEVGARYEKEY
jgi:7,8-dihydroneopterin aldolase/epimerase/oxygenase